MEQSSIKSKLCLGCNTVKPLSSFSPQMRKESFKKGLCHECVNLHDRNARKGIYPKNLTRTAENIFKVRLRKWVRHTYWDHSQRYQITFSQKWLYTLALASPNCGICGVQFEINQNSGGKIANRRSLDRTNNDLILTKSNVQIICVSCNARKGNLPLSAYLATIRESKTP